MEKRAGILVVYLAIIFRILRLVHRDYGHYTLVYTDILPLYFIGVATVKPNPRRFGELSGIPTISVG